MGKNEKEKVNIIYTLAYRLCGDHHSAAELVNKAVQGVDLNGDNNLSQTVKSLYKVFLAEVPAFLQRENSLKRKTNDFNNHHDVVQVALLQLKPRERAIVVMRDVLGFSYTEIADVTMVGEKNVAAILSSGRRALISLLTREAG